MTKETAAKKERAPKKGAAAWKKGRGLLGPIAPLRGAWVAAAESPMGPVRCSRTFTPALGGTYVHLLARWEFQKGAYEEQAFYGAGGDGKLSFWSFTSDGKHSYGRLADVLDVHPDAVGFEAQMPAGLARMVYWPNEDGSVSWAVEAKTKKGWKRFTEHRYTRA